MIKILFIALSLVGAKAYATSCPLTGTCWDWSMTGQSYTGCPAGTFTADESTTGTHLSGSYARPTTGYVKFYNVTCTDTAPLGGNECASVASTLSAVDVKGLGMVVQPILPNESQLIFNLETGNCPNNSIYANVVVTQWNLNGVGSDVSSTSQMGFATVLWDTSDATPTMKVLATRNLVNLNTIVSTTASFNTGVCSNGEVTLTGGGDRGGVVYFAKNALGFLYRSNADHTFWGAQNGSIGNSERAILFGDYAGFSFDPTGATSVRQIKVTISSDLTTGESREILDLDAGTLDGTYRRVIKIPSGSGTVNGVTYPSGGGWNFPYNGMFTGTYSALDAGPYGNLTCTVLTNIGKRQALYCTGQSHDNNSMPINLVLASIQGPPGGDDTTFNGNGKNVHDFAAGDDDTANAVVLQTDGMVLLAGSVMNTSNGTSRDWALARYHADGTLDTGFGTNGYVITDANAGSDIFRAVALQTDGKIVAGGSAMAPSTFTPDFGLARYNPNGTLDTTFNSSGYALTAIGTSSDISWGLVIQTDGMIVQAGYYQAGLGNNDLALVRRRTDGTLDTGFGTGGIVKTAITGGDDQLRAIALQTDGKIVGAGWQTASNKDVIVVRYRTNGTLDTSFATNGRATTTWTGATNEYAYALAIQTDGKIVVGGEGTFSGNDDFIVARYNADGSLDTGFGTGGKASTPVGTSTDIAYALQISNDGLIYLGGTAVVSGNIDYGIVRFTASGVLDTTFDGDGKLTKSIGTGVDDIFGMSIQEDGRIYLVGDSANASGYIDFSLVRIWP